jgi:hypothetical protein
VEGALGAEEAITVLAESDLVVFADGIETDRLTVTWGQAVTLGVAGRRLQLVHRDALDM